MPASGLNVLELDERLRRGQFQDFEWQDLVSFAEQLNQMIEGRVVALREGDAEPVLELDCIDSSEWDVTASDDDPDAIAALRRVADRWPSLS